MAIKRKFELEADDVLPVRIVPWLLCAHLALIYVRGVNSLKNSSNSFRSLTLSRITMSLCQKLNLCALTPFTCDFHPTRVRFRPARARLPLRPVRNASSILDTLILIYLLAAYPTFDIYPLPFFNNDGSVEPNSHSYSHYATQPLDRHSGLLQPSSGFRHHG